MHLTLKAETTRPAAANLLQQQERFDRFVEVFNNDRPHEALSFSCPAEHYQRSPRSFSGCPEHDYSLHDDTATVTAGGHLRLGRGRAAPFFYLSRALARELVGLRELDDGRWLISFAHLDLGHYDPKLKRFIPMDVTEVFSFHAVETET